MGQMSQLQSVETEIEELFLAKWSRRAEDGCPKQQQHRSKWGGLVGPAAKWEL